MALVRSVLEGRLPVTEIFRDRLETCTSCLACETVCPSSVPVSSIIQAAREMAVRDKGTGLIRSLLGAALKNEQAMRISAWLAPLALHYAKRSLVPASRQHASPSASRRGRAGGSRTRVLFFPGCSIAHYQPGIGDDAVSVLERLGYDVVIPEGVKCCGRPLLSLGDRNGAEEVARHNALLLARLGPATVVTACASCTLTFQKEYPRLLPPGIAFPLVRDIHEVLAAGLGHLRMSPSSPALRVTWHDPCHLGRGLGLAGAARQVLRSVPGLTLMEMTDADRCCGFGGVMRVTHRAISDAIRVDKIRNIRATGAAVVITGCPSCRTQLADGLLGCDSTIHVMHTVELIAQVLQAAGDDRGVEKDKDETVTQAAGAT